jgi:hypothetical protein
VSRKAHAHGIIYLAVAKAAKKYLFGALGHKAAKKTNYE